MTSGSVFSGALQTITSTKLEELSKQRTSFNEQHATLLSAAKAEQDPLQRLKVVVDGTKLCLGVKTKARSNGDERPGRVIIDGTRNRRLETDLKNLDRFLEQARFDPSLSTDVLEDWEKKLLQYTSIQATKFQYADLYGKIVTEWLSSDMNTTTDGDVKMGESFEELPSAKRLEARREWEKFVFEPASVDQPALKTYLERLFVTDKKSVASSLNDLRKKVEAFENTLTSSSQFNNHTLRWVINSLQNSDLLSNEKREALRDLLGNDVILTEIADVLNMRLEALDSWTWGEYVSLEQRRQINGQFHIHMHEDILQAIFLHYIGVKWSVFFKAAFLAVRTNPKSWQGNRSDIPKADRMRRGYFLGDQGQKTRGNLEDKRSKIQCKRYFTGQLLEHEQQEIQHNEGEEEAEFAEFVEEQSRQRTKQTFRKSVKAVQAPTAALCAAAPRRAIQAARNATPDDESMGFALFDGPAPKEADNNKEKSESDDEYERQTNNPMEAKQDLLHILATEITLNTRLNGELACFRTVFESWNRLLPHDTTLTVLEFFGVSEKWRLFFKTFLQAPLKFLDDDQSTEPRLRRRGTPSSHALSDVFGEVVLFCLDFSINQNTNGALLYRLSDDVWFWNKDYAKCTSAWASVLEFAKVTGVEINNVKSGSIHIGRDGELGIGDSLPQGDIRWGFLYLNPSNGHFDIDRKMVDAHAEELRRQLQGKSKSVMDWIQTWNSYAVTFFSSNFGKAANCFGREHIDTMLATHRHIQESVFEGGNVVQHLKQMIEDRFNVSNLPDGFLYFPVELGGLDLKSPFVDLLQIRDSVKENPYDLIDEYEEVEKDDYVEAKRRFERGDLENDRQGTEKPNFRPEDPDIFFSIEEFSRYREESARTGKANLKKVYLELLKRPKEEALDASPEVTQAFKDLRRPTHSGGITSWWYGMDAYWRWIAQMYGPDIINRFGSLGIVDPGWLPIGMVGQFRQRKTKWQG